MATKVKLIDETITPTLSGGTFTGNIDLGDNNKIRLGDSEDFNILHDGYNNLIQGSAAGDVLYLQAKAGENSILAVPDGGVNIYHNNLLKLETTAAGATVTGDLAVTGDLNITGNVNSASVTDLDVTDKTITLGAGQTEALSGGSGIIVDGSSASLLWDETATTWDFNNALTIDSPLDASLTLNKTTSSTWNYLQFVNQGTRNFYVGTNNVSDFVLGSDNGGDFYFTGSNVGIGTSSPDSKLTVNVTSNSDGIEFQSSETKIATLHRTAVNSQVVASLDGVATRPIHIGGIVNEDVILGYAGGNVGIGTSSPQGIFQVNGGASPSGSNWINLFNNVGASNPPSVPGGLIFGWNKSNGSGESIIAASAGSAGGSAAPRLDFGLWDGTNYERAMVIDSNARVGINEITPDAYLHITGKTSYTTANDSEVSGLGFVRFQPNDNSEHSLWFHNASNNLGISGYTDAATSSSRDISLQAYGGNVSIGTPTATGAKLHVAGGIKGTDLIAHDSTGINLQTDEGTKRLIVDDAGFVVITDDTTYTANAPTHRGSLVLAGASGFSNYGGLEFHTSSGGGAGYGTRIVSSDASLFIGRRFNATGWTESMRIDDNGNVGIGTNGTPAGKFVISNSGAAGFEFTPGITNFSIANTNYIASYDRSASAYRDISFDMNGTEGGSIRFKAGGYVGIGTASPNQQLDVKSQINVTNAENVSLQGIRGSRFGYSASYKCVVLGPVGTSTPDNIAIGYDPSGNASGSFTGYGKEIIFKNGVEFMTPNDADTSFYNDVFVMKDGSVGIGTSTPDSKLDVNGVINIKSNPVIDSDGTSHYFKTPAGGVMYFYHGSTGVAYIGQGGWFPVTDNAVDLGSTSKRWRNLYTTDLHLSNEGKPEGNQVDGTTGNWTIQEGEEHLYIINNKSGKKYRFALEEIE